MQELIDYIGNIIILPGDEALNCDESEARVKAHLSCLHTRMPFDPQNYQPGERQSYARESLPAASQAGKAHSEFVQPLPFIYRKPCRWKRSTILGTSGAGIFPDAFAGELPY
ncbi:hypothetical protein ACNKHV_17660 [Shigella flexneri]